MDKISGYTIIPGLFHWSSTQCWYYTSWACAIHSTIDYVFTANNRSQVSPARPFTTLS